MMSMGADRKHLFFNGNLGNLIKSIVSNDDDVRGCRSQDGIVDAWLFVRYLTVGLYVGIATVAGFAWWFLFYSVSADPHCLLFGLQTLQ